MDHPALLTIGTDDAAVPVIHLRGTLDERTVALFRDEAARVLLSEPRDVVLDCAELDDADPAGLRCMVEVQRMLPPGGELVVVEAPPRIGRLLALIARDERLLVVDDRGASEVSDRRASG